MGWFPQLRLSTLAVLLVGLVLFCSVQLIAQVKQVRRVLIFNDLSTASSPGFALTDDALIAGLQKSTYQIELYSETLETTLFPDEAMQHAIREWYIQKYRDRKPDVIVAVGRASIKFMVETHEKSFPGIPIIFCGSTEGVLKELKPDSHFTGVWAVARPEETLKAALRLQPATKHVVVIGGVGEFDREAEAIAKESLRNYESKFEFTYLTDLDMPSLLEQLRRLPTDTIVFHTSIMEDAAGTRFIDASQSVPMVAAAANAPVFVLDDVDLRGGTVGGDLLSWAATGQVAAEMAVRVLSGESTHDIPIVKSPNVYMFDWRALRRWGFNERNLPTGSIVLNRQPTLWESYGDYIVAGCVLILLEALLIFGLLWERARRRKVESELELTFDRFRLAVEAGKSVTWDWDLQTGRNQLFGDLQTQFGISSDTHVGDASDFRSRVHPEDRELVRKAVADAKSNRKPYAAEFRLIRDNDRSTRWVRARGRFYYAPNGDAIRMLGMAVDVTDRIEMEQQVRESQERLQGVVTSAMDAIIAVDHEQRIVLFNPAAEKMFGYSAGSVVGKSVDTLLPQRFRFVHGDHIRRFRDSKVTNRVMGTVGAMWGLRSNGEEFPIESSISQTRTEEGGLLTVIIRDITERLQAETAVRESEERFRLVANTAPVMIWMSGPDKLCTYVNQPWLDFTGRSLDAELGNGWEIGVHPDDLKSYLNVYKQAFDEGKPFEMQYRLRRHDGEYRWILDHGVPRLNSDGSLAGYIGSCLDITERKLASEALAGMSRKLIHAHEEERAWIARELHDDINQRIALVSVELERWIQDASNSGISADGHIRKLRSQLGEIGRDVQALSHRLHSSKLEYLGLAVAVGSFCREFAQQHKAEIDFTESNVPRNIPKETALSLYRVLQEALQNAIKHSGVRHFKVALDGKGNEVQLTVRDLGVGFNLQEAINHAGLGLISMRERLQLVRGELSITSEAGQGTTIRARVPIEDAQSQALAAG